MLQAAAWKLPLCVWCRIATVEQACGPGAWYENGHECTAKGVAEMRI